MENKFKGDIISNIKMDINEIFSIQKLKSNVTYIVTFAFNNDNKEYIILCEMFK